MQIIDTHVHFWDLANGINQWVLTDSAALQRNFGPQDLSCPQFVHVQAHDSTVDPVKEIDWLEQNYGDCNARYISYCDFYQDISQVEAQLTTLKNHTQSISSCGATGTQASSAVYKPVHEQRDQCPTKPQLERRRVSKIRGVRQIMSYHPKSAYCPRPNGQLPPDFKQKLQLLKQIDYIFDAQFYAAQTLQALDAIADAGCVTVLEHMGLPLTESAQEMRVWQQMIREVSTIEHITVKLSGFEMLNPIANLEQCLNIILEYLPAERLCYGSNFPVCHPEDSKNWLTTLSAQLPEAYKRAVFYQTAEKIYF